MTSKYNRLNLIEGNTEIVIEDLQASTPKIDMRRLNKWWRDINTLMSSFNVKSATERLTLGELSDRLRRILHAGTM